MSRFYFDLSLTSSRDWRISHGLSHHFYTNMHLDIEVAPFDFIRFSVTFVSSEGALYVIMPYDYPPTF